MCVYLLFILINVFVYINEICEKFQILSHFYTRTLFIYGIKFWNNRSNLYNGILLKILLVLDRKPIMRLALYVNIKLRTIRDSRRIVESFQIQNELKTGLVFQNFTDVPICLCALISEEKKRFPVITYLIC